MSIIYKQFFSGYSVTDYAFYPPPPYSGKGWVITFEDAPIDEWSRSSTTINNIRYPSKAVVIQAKSLNRAQQVAELIFGAHCLREGVLPVSDRPDVIPFTNILNVSDILEQKLYVRGVEYSGISSVCLIAAKVSQKRIFQYALSKHLLSHKILSIDPIHLDPSHWSPGQFVFNSTDYHVQCAYAIVAAYAVLEELSLDLRASVLNPSTINGEWNPKVKDDLENRLTKAGVNLRETFVWELRDTPTKIEHKRKLNTIIKANWAYGKIRDSEVAIIDAIAYASWLRSKVAAHKMSAIASSLNYYNVFAVQSLVRRIFLEVLGVWKTPLYTTCEDDGE